jgi:predicted secreted hydrolase
MQTAAGTGVTYWEGSVSLTGTVKGIKVDGVGYVELTGYAKAFDAPM